jgi:hypothetical protein
MVIPVRMPFFLDAWVSIVLLIPDISHFIFLLSGGPIVLGKGGSKGGMQKPTLQVAVVSGHPLPNCLSGQPNVGVRLSDPVVFNWITGIVLARAGEVVNSGRASKSSKRMLRN